MLLLNTAQTTGYVDHKSQSSLLFQRKGKVKHKTSSSFNLQLNVEMSRRLIHLELQMLDQYGKGIHLCGECYDAFLHLWSVCHLSS
ncbi:hypothetical protein HNY73_002677 [Argiope bruennichi]|uniref:Uncharacterized protein n=1 Tax=Argiope bruennichi TaxID=94029 RepID=A0A8T0FWU5_ARGBR|nr:hypothetical protein HNY73_002677 [Argiope bruennichi]